MTRVELIRVGLEMGFRSKDTEPKIVYTQQVRFTQNDIGFRFFRGGDCLKDAIADLRNGR